MLKVPDEVDQILVAKAHEADQQHVFEHWESLGPAERRALLDQLATVDFQLLKRLSKLIDQEPPPVGAATGIDVAAPTAAERTAQEARGWEALGQGKVACLVVAGGQGTRLGLDAPKGTYPVGPVTQKSLFQLFGEQLLATGRRAGKPVRWYVLTSKQNRAQTAAYFAQNAHFGLEPNDVVFLVQRELPTVDLSGRLLMAGKHELAMNPDGHGGTLRALREARAFQDMTARGIDTLFYFQVDNPLCRIADPAFLGAHLLAGAQASTKVVEKTDPAEKIGLLAERDGKTTVIEYTELGAAEQAQRDAAGKLVFRAGNMAIHAFHVPFLEALVDGGFELTYHVAKKAVPFIGPDGETKKPSSPNAVKFETFIFDLLPEAKTHVTYQVPREEEFEPLKNATGAYSPVTVRKALSDRAARWLQQAGQGVPAGVTCEVSPLTALDPVELKAKLPSLKLEPRDGQLSL